MVLVSLLGRMLIIYQALFRGNALGEDEENGKLSSIVAGNTERL